MFLENPVLQHELVANLRKHRGFLLMAAYVVFLSFLVMLAWPADKRFDVADSLEAKKLFDLFFLGQYIVITMMAPSFAAGAITGEKERKSYEMLLAAPLRPSSIVLGKWTASFVPLAELVICSLPIIMLCLPLGGVHPYEVVAAYVAMILSVGLSVMMSLWCSSFFRRTSAALLVSYFLILPLALGAVLTWQSMAHLGEARLWVVFTVVPAVCLSLGAWLWVDIGRRMRATAHFDSGGQQVVDIEKEAEKSVGLYISRHEFPDRLFAPPKRATLLPDNANPIYDKEIRSEIFGQGTLMLRLVIQISLLLAFLLMPYCLFIRQYQAAWYIAYVLLFNMLVGPVFSAGSITSERERQTLDLLLTTLITPWQILWGKLFAGLRVSAVLTFFLMWPVVLACLMPLEYWHNRNLLTMGGYFLVVATTCVTTTLTALFCSTLFRKSSTSLIASYLILVVLFFLPPSASLFLKYFPASPEASVATHAPLWLEVMSPFSAVFSLPLSIGNFAVVSAWPIPVFYGYLVFAFFYNLLMLLGTRLLLSRHWRVASTS